MLEYFENPYFFYDKVSADDIQKNLRDAENNIRYNRRNSKKIITS